MFFFLWGAFSLFLFYPKAGLTKCQKERQRSLGWNGKPALGDFVPECDTIGKFKASQCQEASGFCWCVDAEGNEIPRTRVRGRAICRPSGKFLALRNSCPLTCNIPVNSSLLNNQLMFSLVGKVLISFFLSIVKDCL